jgi:hypothetical protein
MKKIIILVVAAITLTATNAQAQNWLDALKGVATTAIDSVTGGQLTANALYGAWSYNQPGIKLSSSTNTLSDLTASAAASTLQSKMATYYEKVGIKAGACSFAFNEDGTFISTFGQRTSTGTFTFNAETNQLVLQYNTGLLKLGTINAYAYINGSNLQLLFPMDKLLSLLSSLGSANSSLATITSLLKSYDSVKIGFEFSK